MVRGLEGLYKAMGSVVVDGGVFGVMECLMKDKSRLSSGGGAPGVPVLMPGCFHFELVLYLAPESLLEAVETSAEPACSPSGIQMMISI